MRIQSILVFMVLCVVIISCQDATLLEPLFTAELIKATFVTRSWNTSDIWILEFDNNTTISIRGTYGEIFERNATYRVWEDGRDFTIKKAIE